MTDTHQESGGRRRQPQPMGPYGGANNAPLDSRKRAGALVGAFIGLAWVAGMGWLTVSEAGVAALFALLVFFWYERGVENQARRDLLTDLSQNIHDGTLDASDLRRARGYDAIERRLEYDDAAPDGDDDPADGRGDRPR